MKGIPLVLALVMTCAAWAQSPGTVVLRLDFKNAVGYVDDELDRSKWAMSAEITPPSINQRNFGTFTHISDLVQVNGTPVKGVLMCRFAISRVSPTIPNWGAGDVSVANDASCTVEVFQADAATTPIGSISYNQRTTPMRKAAGAPSIISDGALGPIVGGTGAYFGVGGEFGACAPCGGTGAQRTASVREDPLVRRQLGGSASYTRRAMLGARPERLSVGGGSEAREQRRALDESLHSAGERLEEPPRSKPRPAPDRLGSDQEDALLARVGDRALGHRCAFGAHRFRHSRCALRPCRSRNEHRGCVGPRL